MEEILLRDSLVPAGLGMVLLLVAGDVRTSITPLRIFVLDVEVGGPQNTIIGHDLLL